MIEIILFESKYIDEVIKIEQKSFAIPWSKKSYLEMSQLENVCFALAKIKNNIVGYILFQFSDTDLEMHSIAIDKNYRQQGIATALIHYMFEEAKRLNINFLYLMVRSSNIAAQNLYKKSGFKIIGKRNKYYSDNKEDALIYERQVI